MKGLCLKFTDNDYLRVLYRLLRCDNVICKQMITTTHIYGASSKRSRLYLALMLSGKENCIPQV